MRCSVPLSYLRIVARGAKPVPQSCTKFQRKFGPGRVLIRPVLENNTMATRAFCAPRSLGDTGLIGDGGGGDCAAALGENAGDNNSNVAGAYQGLMMRADEFGSEKFNNCANSQAQWWSKNSAEVACLARAMEDDMGNLAPSDIANVVKAIGSLGYHDEDLLRRLRAEVLEKSGDFNSKDITSCLVGLAKLNHGDDAIIGCLCGEGLDNVEDFSSLDISRSIWAILCVSVDNMFALELVRALWDRLTEPQLTLDNISLQRLYHCQLCLSIEHPTLGLTLPPGLHQAAENVWLRKTPTLSGSSRLHMEVSASLRALKVPHHNEHTVNGLSVDICISKNFARSNQKVVEIDGPAHYLQSSDGKLREKGQSAFKRRLLEKSGLEVLKVPHWEWRQLQSDDERRAYLNKNLKLRLSRVKRRNLKIQTHRKNEKEEAPRGDRKSVV